MYELTAFADLELRPEDLETTGPAISLDGATIPQGIPEQWEKILGHNPRVRRPWDEPGSYPSPSQAANALAWYAGAYGLSKEQAAAVLVAFYAVPGRKPLHRSKLELTLRTWAKGRARLEALNLGAGNGEPPDLDPTDPGPAGSGAEPKRAERIRPPAAGPDAVAVAEAETAEPLPPEAPEAQFPHFPEVAYQGVAAEVARLYAETIEAPAAFLYVDALTFLGALVAGHVGLDSVLREEPRLYGVKVGPSWSSRKSSGQETIERFYKPILQDRVTMCYGTGSAEGLALRMKNKLPAILVYDEFRAFVDKSNVQQSVLLPMVASLFSRTVYENATRTSEIRLLDAHLSLVGACTTETFTTMFTPQFRNIGLLNRLFVVAGKRTTLRPRPGTVPYDAVRRLQDRTLAQVERAERDKPVLRFTAEAGRRWDEWYRAMPESPYAARLDSYGFRFLMLFAVTTESWEITRPLVDAVLPLLAYELALRRELDPVDAETTVARLERLILRNLRRGRITEARLRDYCHAERTGLWAFEMAMNNLKKQGWIGSRKAGKAWQCWLTEAGREAAGDR